MEKAYLKNLKNDFKYILYGGIKKGVEVMDFLTTRGKVLFGAVVLCIFGTIGFMSLNLIILMNENYHLRDDNERLRAIVEEYRNTDRDYRYQKELEKVKAEMNQ